VRLFTPVRAADRPPRAARYGDSMAGNPSQPPSDAGFEVVRRGYDQGQVDAHLRRLDAEISILVTDRDAALAQAVQLARELDEARVRAEKLRAQVRTLASTKQGSQATTERIRSMLRLAEDEVTEMLGRAEAEANRRTQEADAQAAQTIAAARADADAIRDEGRTDAEKMRQEIQQERAAFALELEETRERLAAERTSAEAELEATRERLAAERASAEADLAARIAAAEEQRTRAWAESEAHRRTVEEDFSIAMNQRRTEALAALAAERAAAHREAEQLRESAAAQVREVIARAEEQARERIAEAELRIRDLVTARARIAEQLGRTWTMLEDTLGSLALPPEELIRTALPDRYPAAAAASPGLVPVDPAPSRPDDDHHDRLAAPAEHDEAGSRSEPGSTPDAAPGDDGRSADAPRSDETGAQPAGGNPVRHPSRRQRRRTKAGSSRR
jgi:cell division septum initiation protein DivIVA